MLFHCLLQSNLPSERPRKVAIVGISFLFVVPFEYRSAAVAGTPFVLSPAHLEYTPTVNGICPAHVLLNRVIPTDKLNTLLRSLSRFRFLPTTEYSRFELPIRDYD